MNHTIRSTVRTDREGQTLAIVAVSMVALLALLSLGIELGMAYTARAEAQRAADAGALAGASVFMENPVPEDASEIAEVRARDYASANVVRNRPIHRDDDVQVAILLDEEKVRVRVERRDLPTWFARLIGRDRLTVSAIAAAQVLDAGATNCMAPWAVIDLFERQDGDPVEPDELYDPEIHEYIPATDQCAAGTGYGTDARDPAACDFGMQMTIKSTKPGSGAVPAPGVFMPLRMQPSPNQEKCAPGGGGGAMYRNNICSCNETVVSIGDELSIEPGNVVGPTEQGVTKLIEQDATAQWMANGNPPYLSSNYGYNSPRVVKMALIAPNEITGSGMQDVTVRGFGQFFVEGFEEGEGNNEIVLHGRFLYFVDGTDAGPGSATSPLVKMLKLVE